MLGLPKGTVKLTVYDPNWHRLFAEERANILSVLGVYIEDIQHVGSTAVNGLMSKPIIDIAVGIKSLNLVDKCSPLLEKIGYEDCGIFVKDGTFFYIKGKPTTHHVHLTEKGNPIMEKWLFFRDRLRSCKQLCEQYERLKIRLASQYTYDRDAYGSGKDKFVEKIVSAMKGN